MQKQILGIDISAQTLDIFSSEFQTVITIANQPADIKAFLSKLDASKTIIGMENTGRYNNYLFTFLAKTQFEVYVINPQHLKKSLGLVRGKNDQVDAKRICLFVEKNGGSLNTWICSPKVIEQLKLLMAERSLRIHMKKQLLSTKSTYAFEKNTGLKSKVDQFNTALIKNIDTQIKKLEALILQLIKEDEQLYKQYQWIQSIPGVGNILAWMMIIKTNGFTMLTDPRKLACYAGVVPFDHQSGSSLRYRPRVSHLADKSLKKTLHLAAMSAIRLKNDLQEYYLRKVAEGKNKMSVLNAVRNKLIHRILAVIKRQTPYKINLELS